MDDISNGGLVDQPGSAPSSPAKAVRQRRIWDTIDAAIVEDANAPIPLPAAIGDYGELPNGMRYYVVSNVKPKARAALALVLRVGSLAEEEDERGIAHIWCGFCF